MTATHESLASTNRVQLLKFGLVGTAGYVLNTGAFALSVALGSADLMAATVAFAIAMAANFWCNRRWTFDAGDRPAGGQAARFVAVSVGAFMFGAAVLELLVELARVPSLPAQAASVVAATPLNFFGNKTWAFDEGEPVAETAAPALGAAPNAWLVLPTYNEAENLEPFVRKVLPQLAAATPEHHVLIVDDSSPDGTGEIADRLAAELERVHVLHRASKDGLGRAYVAGFTRALAQGAELVLQMDSDFSHDPASVPDLIAAAGDADLVLGSRYVAGGSVADWGLARRILSRGGSWYARTVLSVPVDDITGGFKCFRRHVLDGLDLQGLRSAGFGFQIEVTYRALQAGARVREVPIRFRDRQAGTSKMSTRIVVEALVQVLALRRAQRLEMPCSAATMATATSASATSATAH